MILISLKMLILLELMVEIECKKCKLFGHATHTCTIVEEPVWIPHRIDQAQQVIDKKDPPISKVTGDVKGDYVEEKWTEVNYSKKTPLTKVTAGGSNKHWSNSFHLLARADGNSYKVGEVQRTSFSAIQKVLEEALEYGIPNP